MAFKTTLELYSSLILPRLAQSPQTCDQLDVPPYALEHLQAHGLAVGRMYGLGKSVAVKVWFLEEDWELLEKAGMTRPALEPRPGCCDPHLWNGIPED